MVTTVVIQDLWSLPTFPSVMNALQSCILHPLSPPNSQVKPSQQDSMSSSSTRSYNAYPLVTKQT